MADSTEEELARIAEIPEGHLLSVPGLRGATCATGVKPSGGADLALVTAETPWTVAGVFTRNTAAAAPIVLCREKLAASRTAKAVVINSGNANALTGAQGDRDARAMVERVEQRCGGPALVLSTGIIGEPLAIDAVLGGIDSASAAQSAEAGPALAQAILTTDTRPKTHAVVIDLDDGRSFTVGGMAKGSGMIHPNMATMLAVMATDAPLTAEAADGILREATDRSFHEISVDGETSTNDAALLLCAPGDRPIEAGSLEAMLIGEAVVRVARSLAEQIVFDGEGASRVLEVKVRGAASREEARKVAEAICRSSLVKTALAGGDPNWGRMLSAAGASGVPIDPSQLELRIEGHCVYADGGVHPVSEDALKAAFGGGRVRVKLVLRRGTSGARMLTTDLTERYVKINAEYTT